MAAGGVLPGRLAAVGGRGIPIQSTLLVTGITGALVLLGDLTRVAALTDAAVLMSFMLVNLSLPWLARRGATGPGRARRTLDLTLPGLALLMCGWLLIHTGWESVAAAAAFALIGLAVGRRRPDRGSNAPMPARPPEGARPG
jgi:APA family basic amino acid/polyamine antiporter